MRPTTMKVLSPWFVVSLVLFFVLPSVVVAQEEELPNSEKAEICMANARPRVERQLAEKGFELGSPIFLRIFKLSKQLEVWMQHGNKFELFKTYPICTYSGSLGPKLREGDQQSPEGFYTVSWGQLNPASRFHLSFDIGYPNAVDRINKRTGSAIMVHGRCISQGCLAMGNLQIEEIYLLAYQSFLHGQKAFDLHIFPFRMTKKNLAAYKDSRWATFWENLRVGYDAFEQDHRVPSIVAANNGTYAVQKEPLRNSVVMINQRIDIKDKL
jgi:murein L,D-transpeptidase YafK